jgi:hypothetical protein
LASRDRHDLGKPPRSQLRLMSQIIAGERDSPGTLLAKTAGTP